MPRICSDIPGALDIPAIPITPSSPEIHVLAVDDSAIDRKVVERLLMISAFKVTTAESGARALEILGIRDGDNSLPGNANSINLILTDYCMPGMTGYDLLKRVKGIPALKDIPVIIMSSENVTSRINRCLAEGAEDFILKPLKMSDMKRLKGLICQTRPRTVEPSGVSLSVKRKILTDSLANENAERRPRLEVVIVT